MLTGLATTTTTTTTTTTNAHWVGNDNNYNNNNNKCSLGWQQQQQQMLTGLATTTTTTTTTTTNAHWVGQLLSSRVYTYDGSYPADIEDSDVSLNHAQLRLFNPLSVHHTRRPVMSLVNQMSGNLLKFLTSRHDVKTHNVLILRFIVTTGWAKKKPDCFKCE